MPAYKFSPNLASAEERRETFVVREDILENLLDRARKADAGLQHGILIGPRGIGKTHLLLLLADTIEADEALAAKWVVVRFAEEEYSITSLAELLLRVVESLPDGNAGDMGRDADRLLGTILDFHAAFGKRILLLLDNIQLYFSQFMEVDIGRLRDILMSKPVFLIIGAAPSYFKQMVGYEEAFYQFFEPIHLVDFTSQEAEQMLQVRAEFEGAGDFLAGFDTCRPKIRAASHLTGGNPRLILMLYQVMCEAGVVEAAEAFKRLLDELTPYFQERMLNLAPQMRKLLDTLALLEGPATPTELAEAAGMSVNKVSSQIARLKEGGYVQQVKLKQGRETRYEVTERLYRMWRIMRTEAGRRRFSFLVRFLNLWYTPTQLLDEAGKLLNLLPEATDREKPRLLLHLQYLKEASPELVQPELEKAYTHVASGSLEPARIEMEPVRNLAQYEEKLLVDPGDITAWTGQGVALGNLRRYAEALESFDKALERQPEDAIAWRNRGIALNNLRRHEEALESFDKALERQPENAATWFGKGVALRRLNRHQQAFDSFDRVVVIQPGNVPAWLNRGIALIDLGELESGLESMRKAAEFVETQKLENIAEFAGAVTIQTGLSASLQHLTRNNQGAAVEALRSAAESAEQMDTEDFQLLLFGYLRSVLRSGNVSFVGEAIEILAAELGEDYTELLRPFRVTSEYLQTQDVRILERLQQEERELVRQIAEEAKKASRDA